MQDSAAPVEVDGVLEGVGAFSFEAALFEGEVPFGGDVGVVDEHEAGVRAEAAGLLDHGLLVLGDELCAEVSGDGCDEGDAVGDVPGGDDVDAAGGGGGGGDGGERGEPALFAARVDGPDGFVAAIGENEVDGGDGFAEETVGCAVGGRRVGGHAKAGIAAGVSGILDGFEVLGFFVDAGAAAPPPGAVDEGTVRGVHEADDAVVDVAGEVGGEVRGAEAGAEFGELGDGGELGGVGDAAGAGGWDVDPGVAVALGDGEGVGEDFCGSEVVEAGEGGDLFAAAGAGLEAPAVVFALDGFAVEPTGGEGDAAMGAEVAEGEEGAVGFAAEEHGDAEQRGDGGGVGAEFGGAEGGIPVAEDHLCGRSGLCGVGGRGVDVHEVLLSADWSHLASAVALDVAHDAKFTRYFYPGCHEASTLLLSAHSHSITTAFDAARHFCAVGGVLREFYVVDAAAAG